MDRCSVATDQIGHGEPGPLSATAPFPDGESARVTRDDQRPEPANALRRWSFAVIADTHLNPVDDVSTSPWQTNAAANARSRAIVAELNAAGVDFVVHLGDMIHPIPSHPDYPVAAARFHAIFSDLAVPLYVVPGNHDVGDKPIAWTPAPAIDATFLATYREHFGNDRYAFDHETATFVVVDAQLLNAPMQEAADHDAWLATTLADARARGRRIFVVMHYPLYLHHPTEQSHYDNLDEPARSRVLELIVDHGVEAVFAGHVHNFFYDHLSGIDFYVAPSTAFVRHDYAELFRVGPADQEHGRADAAKLGYFIVDVTDTGHVVHHRRTASLTLASHENLTCRPVVRTRPATTRSSPPMVLDLRHRWADEAEIPHTGGVDEMGRKLVRNDYVLQALFELGLWNLRVPAGDLTAPVARKRIVDLHRWGMRWSVFTWCADVERLAAALDGVADAVDDIEIIGPSGPGAMQPWAESIRHLRTVHGGTITWSPLQGHDTHGLEEPADAEPRPTVHAIRHGMSPGLDELRAGFMSAADRALIGDLFERVTVRVGEHHDVWESIEAADAAGKAHGFGVNVHVQAAADVPSTVTAERTMIERVVAALTASSVHPDTRVIFDTFVDHDRGYFPRVGLFDRRFNPRTGANIVATLGTILATFDPHIDPIIVLPEGLIDGATALVVDRTGARRVTVVRGRTVAAATDDAATSTVHSGPVTRVDLASGTVVEEVWSCELADTHVRFGIDTGTASGGSSQSLSSNAHVVLPTVDLAAWRSRDLIIDRWVDDR